MAIDLFPIDEEQTAARGGRTTPAPLNLFPAHTPAPPVTAAIQGPIEGTLEPPPPDPRQHPLDRELVLLYKYMKERHPVELKNTIKAAELIAFGVPDVTDAAVIAGRVIGKGNAKKLGRALVDMFKERPRRLDSSPPGVEGFRMFPNRRPADWPVGGSVEGYAEAQRLGMKAKRSYIERQNRAVAEQLDPEQVNALLVNNYNQIIEGVNKAYPGMRLKALPLQPKRTFGKEIFYRGQDGRHITQTKDARGVTWFTPSKEYASEYGTEIVERRLALGKVFDEQKTVLSQQEIDFLNTNFPLEQGRPLSIDERIAIRKAGREPDLFERNYTWDFLGETRDKWYNDVKYGSEVDAKIFHGLRALGYDSIKAAERHYTEAGDERWVRSIGVFNPDQIRAGKPIKAFHGTPPGKQLTKKKISQGEFRPKLHKISDSFPVNVGDRWEVDVGAIPGEPYFIHDTGKLAITEQPVGGNSAFWRVLQEDKGALADFTKLEDAVQFAEDFASKKTARGMPVVKGSPVEPTRIPSIMHVADYMVDSDTGVMKANKRWSFVEPSQDPRIDPASWGVALDYDGYVESGGAPFKAIIEPVTDIGLGDEYDEWGYFRLVTEDGFTENFSTLEEAMDWVKKAGKRFKQ